MRILIAGGTAVSRRALTTLLGTRPNLEIVGDTALVSQIATSLTEMDPDLVLLNGLPRDDSEMDLIKTVDAAVPQSAVLVLSTRQHLKDDSLAAGADAFVLKGDPPSSLLTTLETIRLSRSDL